MTEVKKATGPAASPHNAEGGRFRQSFPKGGFLHSYGTSENDTLIARLSGVCKNDIKKKQLHGSASDLNDSLQFK